MMGRRALATLIVSACCLPLAFAQWGRGGGDPRGYGGGYGGGGGGYGGGGYQQQQQQPAANAVARPGGDSSLDDSVRLFLQLDQDGMLVFCHFCLLPIASCWRVCVHPCCVCTPTRTAFAVNYFWILVVLARGRK